MHNGAGFFFGGSPDMESDLRRLRTLSLAVTTFAALVCLTGMVLLGWIAKDEFFSSNPDIEVTADRDAELEELLARMEREEEARAAASQDQSRPPELIGYGEKEPEDGIYYHSEGYDPETDTFINETQFESEDYGQPEEYDRSYYDDEDGMAGSYPSAGESFLELWLEPEGLTLTALLLLTLAFFVAAMMWVWRAHANLGVYGIRLKNSPRRAVANYFIPGLNLVLPFESMRELYNRSEGESEDFAHASVPDVNAWWTVVAVGLMIFVVLLAKSVINEITPFYFSTPALMEFVVVAFALLLLLASTILFAGLTRRISAFQADFLPHLDPQEVVEEAPARMTVRIVSGSNT